MRIPGILKNFLRGKSTSTGEAEATAKKPDEAKPEALPTVPQPPTVLLLSARVRQVTFAESELTEAQLADIGVLKAQFERQPALRGSEQWFSDMELLCERAHLDHSLVVSRGMILQIGRAQRFPELLPKGMEWLMVLAALVSKKHAQVELDHDGLLWVRDESKHGTTIFRKVKQRDEHYQEIKLSPGQQARIYPGDYLFLGPLKAREGWSLLAVEGPDE